MTVGTRQYNEAEMLQMQREAEARVREMQIRARRTLQEADPSDLPAPRNRNWSSNAGMFRQPRRGGMHQGQRPGQQPDPPPEAEAPKPESEAGEPAAPPPPPEPPVLPPDGESAPKGTIIGDIMSALGLDEDYLLIIGLLLILVNQRADTTLVLALVYLLF